MCDDITQIVMKPVESEGELFQALAIREVVFIEEQSVPERLERDAEDAHAFHVLAFQGKHAVGTGRLVPLTCAPEGETGVWVRLGRMAVLQASRRKGIGHKLLMALEAEAKRRQVTGIVLHVQLWFIAFYTRYGYEVRCAVFEEVGMPHRVMYKRLLPTALP